MNVPQGEYHFTSACTNAGRQVLLNKLFFVEPQHFERSSFQRMSLDKDAMKGKAKLHGESGNSLFSSIA